MASISCTELDCVDGTCKQTCFTRCGGESQTSDFQCGLAGVLCECVGTTNSSAAVWGSVLGAVCVLVCIITFFKYWCGARRAASERQRIVVIT
jgi:hypothetical protein